MFDILLKGRKVLQQPETIGGVAASSSPGVVYTVYAYLAAQPIEKWVSTATFILIALQIFFLLKDQMKKRRERKQAK